jgi:hypothetical protein
MATIDICAASEGQLAEMESVRQTVLALTEDSPQAECADVEERIAELEATIPRMDHKENRPITEPLPQCEQEETNATRAISHVTRAFLNTRANLLLSSDPDRTASRAVSAGQTAVIQLI